ncbi:hypothetical protein AB9F35_20695 [Rhizobium leguminosarum]|uniref:hypothetical protein n=1 Tax=Rhizobium leguminosarum TaxID=384 RepID=UPI0013D932B9|nr:hypothetical protein [Rhizobium leguminosarum]NEK37760.1 hypothetical protein [Rhizobium leguminosarum]
MRRYFPISLLGLVVTAVVFALQAIPFTGIFLMFAFAMVWSIVLVNASMIGVAIEAIVGRVSRLWLLLPLIFCGGYWTAAALDHFALRDLASRTNAANAQVVTGFDPARQALVFAKGGAWDGAWLTQNFALPVTYSVSPNFPEGYLSNRMIDSAVCAKVRATRALQSAFVQALDFHDGEALDDRRTENRFCNLSMPEKPELPIVTVSQEETKDFEKSLPVRLITTTITMPDGRRFQLLGGTAAPLSWIPMPIIGCFLNSGAPSWDCSAGFSRNGFTPIISSNTPYKGDSTALARALGLKPVAIEDRVGSDSAVILAKIAATEEATLARQIANVDAMIADPAAKVTEWQVDVLANRTDALTSRAEAIMTGIERAAAMTGRLRSSARESGRILARLAAALPPDKFVELGPRLLSVYASADDDHWLWETEPLLRRLGDLGPGALPYLANPRASLPSVNGAGVEGLCRVGSSGRALAEPLLLALWAKPNLGYDRLSDLFAAMRRMGISPPPLVDDKRNLFAKLQADWADVSPSSPPRVCATHAELGARQQEKNGGIRRNNLY